MRIKPEDRFWIAIYGFAAFILCVAVGVFGWLAYQSHQEASEGPTAHSKPLLYTAPFAEEEFSVLARFQAPPYNRVPSDPAAFAMAMQRYTRGDYAGAGPKLRALTQSQPDFTPARFYLGICLLLTADRLSGIEELRSVTESGAGPYLERARFYLAKGLIGEHDLNHASEELRSAIAQHGDLEKQAQALLDQIQPSR
ncbi:MAG TPA: hypothetical protein VMB25_16930 [Bryobacteraceae bacterium]|nr:hypothetical protein [Bryobacteraceae bacterium]